MQLVVPPEVRRVELGGGGVAQREEVVRLAGRQAQRVDHGVGTPNDPSSGSGVGERVLERQRRHFVLAEGVDDVERVGSGSIPARSSSAILPTDSRMAESCSEKRVTSSSTGRAARASRRAAPALS